MHIIIGEENANNLEDKYTCLELDVFRFTEDGPAVQAYCVLETVSMDSMINLEQQTNLHRKLIENYQKKNWTFCEQALENLQGKWNGEIDSFYDEMNTRVNKYKDEDPGENWDFVIKNY